LAATSKLGDLSSAEPQLATSVAAGDLHAVVTEVDPAPARPGPLAGKRLLVKDLFDTAGIRTTYGSKIYGDNVPTQTAPAVQQLIDGGAVLVGKANLHEFAWGVTNQNPWYGTVCNPRSPHLTSGGSSGGNAAALAAGLCEIGLGTDTAGSIRIPSACCGTVGLKPQAGRITTDGVFPLCPSFDTVGPMANTVRDVALAWSVLTATSIPAPRLQGLRVGLLRRPPHLGGVEAPTNPLAERYAARLESLGATVEQTEIPGTAADVQPMFLDEGARSHSATFPSRADEYGQNVREKLEHAVALEPANVVAAREEVERWRREIARSRLRHDNYDLYIAPVLANGIPVADCDELKIRAAATAFCRPFNILGWSALAIGEIQLVAPTDEVVIAAGLLWEQAGL
jgi:aspartyl-tRNA(Asn)/glutamyl-tRNA(Gln) amidotransferase subunit A